MLIIACLSLNVMIKSSVQQDEYNKNIPDFIVGPD